MVLVANVGAFGMSSNKRVWYGYNSATLAVAYTRVWSDSINTARFFGALNISSTTVSFFHVCKVVLADQGPALRSGPAHLKVVSY